MLGKQGRLSSTISSKYFTVSLHRIESDLNFGLGRNLKGINQPFNFLPFRFNEDKLNYCFAAYCNILFKILAVLPSKS